MISKDNSKHLCLSLFFTLRSLKMISILSIDPALGRLDYDSLSDQALMEMLVEGIAQSKKAEFQDTHGNYRDTCDWSGTFCKDERVTGIVLSWKEFGERQFPFDVIPPLVERFIMKESNLHGTRLVCSSASADGLL